MAVPVRAMGMLVSMRTAMRMHVLDDTVTMTLAPEQLVRRRVCHAAKSNAAR